MEPTEIGFYKYSGGNQAIIFLLSYIYDTEGNIINDRQWYVVTSSASMSKCKWGYIEQALSVYDLVRI